MSVLHSEKAVEQTRDPQRGIDPASIRRSFINHISFTQAKSARLCHAARPLPGLAMTVRDRLIKRWIATRKAYYSSPEVKRVYYLSLEFLIGAPWATPW